MICIIGMVSVLAAAYILLILKASRDPRIRMM